MPYKNPEDKKKWMKVFWADKPKSAHAYYQFWKSLDGLNSVELQVLFGKRKSDCKYVKSSVELNRLKAEMCIINEVYEKVRKEEKDIYYQEKQYEEYYTDDDVVSDEYGDYVVIDEYTDQDDW